MLDALVPLGAACNSFWATSSRVFAFAFVTSRHNKVCLPWFELRCFACQRPSKLNFAFIAIWRLFRGATAFVLRMTDITHILSADNRGDACAAEELLPLVYAELRCLARQKLSRERPGQSLDATGLVHEAYLRLMTPNQDVGQKQLWEGRAHFFAAAAEAMRRILVEMRASQAPAQAWRQSEPPFRQ